MRKLNVLFIVALLVSQFAFVMPAQAAPPSQKGTGNNKSRITGPQYDPYYVFIREPVLENLQDNMNLIDVDRTYMELVNIMGREPTPEEIIAMTALTEVYSMIADNGNMLRILQEAIARAYYHFCDTDGCTRQELYKFLSGYQVWFGRNGRTDKTTVPLAMKMYNLMVNKELYELSNGEYMYGLIDQILDLEYARTQGWTSGLHNNRPWQWFGPFPAKGEVDALACMKVGEGQRFCFFTYLQTQKFSP